MDAAQSFLGAFQASEQRQSACPLAAARQSDSSWRLWLCEARKPSRSRADSSSNSAANQSAGGGACWQRMLMNICKQQSRGARTGQGRHGIGLPTSYQFLRRDIWRISISLLCTPCFVLATRFCYNLPLNLGEAASDTLLHLKSQFWAFT